MAAGREKPGIPLPLPDICSARQPGCVPSGGRPGRHPLCAAVSCDALYHRRFSQNELCPLSDRRIFRRHPDRHDSLQSGPVSVYPRPSISLLHHLYRLFAAVAVRSRRTFPVYLAAAGRISDVRHPGVRSPDDDFCRFFRHCLSQHTENGSPPRQTAQGPGGFYRDDHCAGFAETVMAWQFAVLPLGTGGFRRSFHGRPVVFALRFPAGPVLPHRLRCLSAVRFRLLFQILRSDPQ